MICTILIILTSPPPSPSLPPSPSWWWRPGGQGGQSYQAVNRTMSHPFLCKLPTIDRNCFHQIYQWRYLAKMYWVLTSDISQGRDKRHHQTRWGETGTPWLSLVQLQGERSLYLPDKIVLMLVDSHLPHSQLIPLQASPNPPPYISPSLSG